MMPFAAVEAVEVDGLWFLVDRSHAVEAVGIWDLDAET